MKLVRIIYLFAVVTGLSATAAPSDKQPNIVLILADDYGYGSAVCYGANPDIIKTPAIDQLAREGMRFTAAHTPSSVCTPTRYAVLTGSYCWRNPTKLNGGGTLNTTDPLLIATDRLTIASLLKKQGYQTAMIGKWHLGYGTAPKHDFTKELKPGPLELGFDYQFAVPQNHSDNTRVYVENHTVYGLRSKNLNPQKGKIGLDAPEREDPKTSGVLADHAVNWIGKQTAEKPFFLYFTPIAVHGPITPSAEATGISKAGPYGDFIYDLDLSVKRIMEKLAEMKLAENTLIIFTSDNGGNIATGETSDRRLAMEAGLKINGDQLRGGKHEIWEGGFRVPFIARWPGKIKSGSTSDQSVNLVDIFATFSDILGESLPDPTVAAPDSFTMLPILLGKGQTQRPDMILQSAKDEYALLKGPWKLILPPASNGKKKKSTEPQLYNLETDLGETTDLAAQHPEVVKNLSDLLDGYRKQSYSRN